MMARGLKLKSDGMMCNTEEARMLVQVAGEGIVPVLSALQNNVRKCYPGFCRCVGSGCSETLEHRTPLQMSKRKRRCGRSCSRMKRRRLVISGGLAVQVASLDVREQMRFKDAIL